MTSSGTKPDQVLGCVMQPVSAAGAQKGQKATEQGIHSGKNWIPKSAFKYIPRTWEPGLKGCQGAKPFRVKSPRGEACAMSQEGRGAKC